MKKIININLAGRVVPIEDTAYEKLQQYLESLRRYFAREEGRDEIINDIESRIAEIMNEKIRKGATCVTEDDVEGIIASMGRVEDFADSDMDMPEADTEGNPKNESSSTAEPNFTFGRTRRSRLRRDMNDRLLGGVCSGLANYLNVDPAIVRLIFAILTLGGFGTGLLIYIVMWLILPSENLERFEGRRLYRNPDGRVLGGVCSGLAVYFDKEVWIPRLIFAAPLILNILGGVLNGPFHWVFPNVIFGSLSGTFILTYIVMWIVLPEASSEYQKMEMRGERVDVNRIRQTVQDRAKEFSDEVRQSAKNFSQRVSDYSKDRGQTFSQEVGQAGSRIGPTIGHAFAVVFKVFFMIVFGSIAVGLFFALIGLLFSGVAWWPVNNFLWTSSTQQMFFWGTIIFFLAVPLIGFIIWLIRRIMGIRSRNSYLGWTFGGLWFLGWVAVVMFAASISRDFSNFGEVSNEISMSQPANNKLTVGVTEPELRYSGSFFWDDDGPDGWQLTDDSMMLAWVNIDVSKSLDSNYHVVLWKQSAGRTYNEARDRADAIEYTIHTGDSFLDLGNGFAVGKEDKYRGQHIKVEIRVPAGKQIRFDPSIREKLNDVSFNMRRRDRDDDWGRGIRINHHDFSWYTNIDYTMDENGNLYDASAPVRNNNEEKKQTETPSTRDGYRYSPPESPAAPSLDQREKELQEELKKVQEQKDKLKDSSNPTGVQRVPVSKESLPLAGPAALSAKLLLI